MNCKKAILIVYDLILVSTLGGFGPGALGLAARGLRAGGLGLHRGRVLQSLQLSVRQLALVPVSAGNESVGCC